MERDLESGAQDINFIHFNSHAHVERDAENGNDYFAVIISTHTLTWSVTDIIVHGVKLFDISTHTLTWSVTILPL